MTSTFTAAAAKFAFAALVALSLSATPAAAATIGEKAPDFSLPAADGSTQSLSSFAGKVVVLEWFNKDCPFVRKHYDSQNMQNLQKEYTAKDVVWLTVNSSAEGEQGHETVEATKETLAKEKSAATHYLFDTDGKVGKSYDAKTTPHMFVIDKEGKLAYAGAIDDKPSAKQEDIAGAKNYVRAAVDAVLEGKPVAEATTKAYGCGVKYAD